MPRKEVIRPVVILGIDPGLGSTGVGVIQEQPGRRWKALFHEDVLTTAAMPLPARLERINDLVVKTIEEYAPDAAAVESVFFARNVRSVVMMAHGRGVAILAAARTGLEVFEYSPLEIKQSVVGKGRAGKEQVRQMVGVLLGMAKPPRSEHQSDALACALCHAFRSGAVETRAKLMQQTAEAGGDEAWEKRKALLAMAMQRSGRKRR